MFIFCHKNFYETKFSDYQILLGTDYHSKGPVIEDGASAVAALEAAAHAAE